MTRTLLLVLAAAPLAAQEVAVPMDSAGRLAVIDRQLERRLQLFPEIPGFLEARLFAAPDGSFTLEITHRIDGRLARTRRALTAGEAQAFRDRVLAALAVGARHALLDQSGRGELLRGAFALALGFNGYAVPIALDVDDDRTAVGLYSITAAVSFFLPLALTAQAPVTQGQASLALWGGIRGIFHGMMTAAFFDETSTRAVFGYGLVGSVTEGLAGFFLAGRHQYAQGHADAMGMLGDIGGGVGLAAAYVVGDDTPGDHDAIWAAGVLTSFAGLYAGHQLARRDHITRGDVGVFRAAALLGTWTGFTVAFLADDDAPFEDEVAQNEVLGALLGTGGGLVAARLLTRGRDFTTAHGTLVSIGALGGGLLGSGLGYLATPDSDDQDIVLLGGAAGALLGFGLVYAATAGEARDALELSGVSLQVNPAALALRDAPLRVPLAGLAVRF